MSNVILRNNQWEKIYPTFRTFKVIQIAFLNKWAQQANNLQVNRAHVEHLTQGYLIT